MMELLWESRKNLGGMQGILRSVQHRPFIRPEPVLLADSPGDGKRVSIYGSVLPIDGGYRMWYYAVPTFSENKVDDAHVAFADSTDGIHWTKPMRTDRGNLTDLGLHSATVFIDPHSQAARRFRAVGTGKPYPGANPAVSTPGYYTAHSADGLSWTFDATAPRWNATDVVTSIYHAGRDCGLIAMKRTPHVRRMGRRSIYTATYRDGAYSDDVMALQPDEFDDAQASGRGFHSCDYYGMGMMAAGRDATVGFLWRYWHQLPYVKGWQTGPMGLYGTSDVSLVYQEEPGASWVHAPGRELFLDRDQLPPETQWINTASNVLDVGDEQRLYFLYRRSPHGYGLDTDWKVVNRDFHPDDCAITYASWPRGRIFGLKSQLEANLRINLGRITQPSRLYLNLSTDRHDSVVHADLWSGTENIHSFADCLPITGDHAAVALAWNHTDIILPGDPVKINLRLRDATVYAYELRPA